MSSGPGGTVPHVEWNVRALIQAIRQDVVPFARCSAQMAKVAVSWVWPEDFHIPPPLSQPIPESHFSDVALKCLQTVVTPRDVSDELTATLDAHVPLRTAGQRDNHIRMIADLLDRRHALRRCVTAQGSKGEDGGRQVVARARVR